MYTLVNDVDQYADFLPWCKSSRVIESDESHMVASIEISKGALEKTFTTRNKLVRDESIEMELVDGPFKSLHGHWRFSPLKAENACKVALVLDFDFENSLMSIAVKPVFTQIANSMVDSFCQRAIEVYGERD